MSTTAPSRRLIRSGVLQCFHQNPSSTTPSLQHRRTLFGFFKNKSASGGAPSNPVLDEYLKKKPSGTPNAQPQLVRGDLASSSIFDADKQITEREASSQAAEDEVAVGGKLRNQVHMSTIIDPDPRSRERWERKMVIRDIRKGGRLSKEQFVKRTEREHAAKSHNIKTSVKKLGPLARQIAGKSIEDAIVQMRFSKKKAAKEVLEYLEYARDQAVVQRGMGLGQVEVKEDAENLNHSDDVAVGEGADTKSGKKPLEIQLKDGKRHKVTDFSKIYIDQAWVGRGPYGQAPDYRARGRMHIMRTPWTHLSVVLKEEATRVREYAEREEKRRRQRLNKVWTPLPDRPISAQQQWYTW